MVSLSGGISHENSNSDDDQGLQQAHYLRPSCLKHGSMANCAARHGADCCASPSAASMAFRYSSSSRCLLFTLICSRSLIHQHVMLGARDRKVIEHTSTHNSPDTQHSRSSMSSKACAIDKARRVMITIAMATVGIPDGSATKC